MSGTYSTRSLKGTALLAETGVLLRAWRPGESGIDLRRRVLAEDLLGKASTKRAKDLVDLVFGKRFLGPGGVPAIHLQHIVNTRGSGDWLIHIGLVLAARNDVVLRDAVNIVLPRAKGGYVGNEAIYRRLLTKSSEGESRLKDWFKLNGPLTVNATRIAGTSTPFPDLDQDSFVRFYPLLPTHFEILLALVRVLARRGVGLRSAIKVIQDILVDPHTHLPAGIRPIAERDFGSLACVDELYDTLRADIERDLPHVVAGVERVRAEFPGDELALRLAKAIAALQPLDNFPRTAENLAALIYRGSGGPGVLAQVRETLQRMVAQTIPRPCTVVCS